MVYILGGTSRSGKTSLARRAVIEKGMPYFPLDALLYGLVNGVPELGITWKQPFVERAEKAWPVAKPTIEFFFHQERDFLVEGDSILPNQVEEFTREGHETRCCFIGYTELRKEEKLALVRTHHQGEMDWTKDISDEEMLGMVDEMILFSKYLKEECGKFGLKYFDVSYDFDGAREDVLAYLFAE